MPQSLRTTLSTKRTTLEQIEDKIKELEKQIEELTDLHEILKRDPDFERFFEIMLKYQI